MKKPMNTDSEVSAHYSSGDLLGRLNAALSDDGVEPAHLSLQALAPYDQFHGRGVAPGQIRWANDVRMR
jgi:hypothetical protein